MAFSNFRYHPDAEAGLIALLARGDDTFQQLIAEIRKIQATWEPENKDDNLFTVPFHGFYLIFTIAQADKSILVLAAVEPQPP